MTISVFEDGEKKNKVAEFYDMNYPCAFLRGILEGAKENETDAQLVFTARQDIDVKNMRMKRAVIE